jgi:pre-peptidase/List-Bact-rpt repeat protein
MRGFLKPILTAAAAVLLSLCFAVTSRSQSMPGYQAADKRKPATELSNSQKAAQGKAPLAKLYSQLKPNSAKTKLLPALTPKEKKRKVEKQFQIGVTRSLLTELNPLTDSALYSIAEGDVRVAEVVSTGALSMRLRFKGMSLPKGARVFVYSANNPDQFAGPYEGLGPWGDGTLWTPPLPGSSLIVEYFAPAGTASSHVPFVVSEVSHIFKDIFSPNDPAGSCNLDITQPWTQVAKSVGLLDFVSGGAEFTCTGTLLNDAAQDQKPFVLTANHCINTQSEAQSVIVFWNYLSGDFPFGTQTTTGANLLVNGSASDFSLLLLTGSVPVADVFFSGWDASPVAASTPVTGIHHPSGSHKRISFGATNVSCPAGLPGPCQNFTGVTWSQGVTEPGSSGSGIWTGNGDPASAKLVGQLYGGLSECANPTGSDYYGRFSVTYPNVAGFLNGSCVSSVTPTNQDFPASGGSGSITVNAPDGCSWSASSTDDFVTITGGVNGSGGGTVNFTVATNLNGLPREASIVVGTQLFAIRQQRRTDAGCAPTGISIDQVVNGNLQPNCPAGNGAYVDAYAFSANAGQKILINLSTAQFDTLLYLLNTDGNILALNDDSNNSSNSRIPLGSGVFTLPNTGTYTILASSFAPGKTGLYTLRLTPPRTLTVASSNPNSGVSISASLDLNGVSGSAPSPFTRSYSNFQSVSVTAPTTASGNIFLKWQKDGSDYSSSTTIVFDMEADHTVTAVYRPLNDYVLTVDAPSAGNGVNVTVSPNDNNGAGDGTTQFTRTYKENMSVTLTAPVTAPNGYVFQKWQQDNANFSLNTTAFVFMNTAHTLTAVYLPPVASTMTVNTSNPSTGVSITISPNDNNGAGGGIAPFTRTFFQTNKVTLTAPATAPNGNRFDRWLKDGSVWTFSQSADVFFGTTAFTMTAVYASTPVVLTETDTNNAAAVNSVTLLRGPFQILDPNNFSMDGHTRIILFVANLPGPDPSLTVVAANAQLPIEAVGQLSNLPGMTGTAGVYIVCKLPDGLPTGPLQLNVLFNGITSQPVTLNISP